MPICYCQFSECNGADISISAFNRHRREDRIAMFRNATNAAGRIFRRQDNAISAFLTSGSRRHGPLNTGGLNAPSSRAETYQHMVNTRLHQLSIIEKKVDGLLNSTELKLLSLEMPRSRGDSFPLSSCTASVREMFHDLSSITSKSPAVQAAKSSVSDRLYGLMHQLRDARARWKKAQDELEPPIGRPPTACRPFYDTEKHTLSILPNVDPVIQLTVFTMVVLQVVLHVSRRGCRFFLAMIYFIVQLTLLRHGPLLSVHDQKLLSDFPKDPETAVKQFLLDSDETIYAVCPRASCHKLYGPTFDGSSPIPTYPLYCSVCQFNGQMECGTRLTRPRYFGDSKIEVPIKKFISFSFKGYVASLTSRAGFEDYMDRDLTAQNGPEIQDVFGGSFLRNFRGPDGKPFLQEGNNSGGRYCFSLGFDFFNPFSNKQSGKKTSFGIVSAVCLNLPVHLRYKPENMFLAGIIPGPNEPPLTTTNNYLAPIIDEFLEFWSPGVRFSQTAKFPYGRLILCALILVICDLPAARKISGFASCTSEHFCNVCHCRLSKPGLQDTDHSGWIIRTDREYREVMDQYQDAATDGAREAIFKEHGIRSSELRRLTYFDMIDCVVVDPAHNHFLGLINEHFTNILGIRLKSYQEDPVLQIVFDRIPSNLPENTKKGIERIRNWLQGPFSVTFGPTKEQGVKKLMRVNKEALQFVCTQVNCPLPPIQGNRSENTKEEYCESILDWRGRQTEARNCEAKTSTLCGHVLQPEEMASIWLDLEQMLTPSWMTSVPMRLGQPSHGKLKADQWRTLGTTYLAISLIRLWALSSENSERSRRCYDIMRVTLSLVSAIILATSATVTAANADAYLAYMVEYLNGVKDLFPEYKLKPNHHMALHVHHYLRLFGPVHSWWAFPFERLVGRLQRIPNNGKVGEMEDTMARAYMRMCNLQLLLSRRGCPEAIQNSRSYFEALFDSQSREIIQTNIQPSSSDVTGGIQGVERALPPDLRLVLMRANISVPTRAHLPTHIHINGLAYTTSNKHPGNSCTMVTPSGAKEPVPAQIVYIVQFKSGSKNSVTYLGIRRYRIANITRDPYLCFPVLKAQIWEARFEELEVISLSQVVCHFACLPVKFEDQELVVAMSLSRKIVLHDTDENSLSSN